MAFDSDVKFFALNSDQALSPSQNFEYVNRDEPGR